MMKPFFEQSIFPADVKQAIVSYLENPSASSCTDLNLFRVLNRYDKKPEGILHIERLPINSLFSIKNNRIFKKGELVRKRYKCVEVKTGAVYLFNPLSEVTRVS